jgi:hypothetical protein
MMQLLDSKPESYGDTEAKQTVQTSRLFQNRDPIKKVNRLQQSM